MAPTEPYGPIVARLLHPERLPALGPGSPNSAVKATLATFDITKDLGQPIRNQGMAQACLAGLWLLHDYLDESHTISQSLHTVEGSYWHAIMHRREPDAWNSQYWFRRVGPHPVLAQLAPQATALGCNYTTPSEFVDFCEQVRGTGSANEELARRVQLLEWQLLFDHCYRSAIK